MITGTDECFRACESMRVVTQWVTVVLVGCLWATALGVAGLVIARADALWVRAVALVVPFFLLVTSFLGTGWVVDWLGKELPRLKAHGVLVLGAVVTIGVICTVFLFLVSWSALVVVAMLFAVTGALLIHRLLETRQVAFWEATCQEDRPKRFEQTFWTFLFPCCPIHTLTMKPENCQVGGLFSPGWSGPQVEIRSLNHALPTRNRRRGNILPRPTRSSRQPMQRPYFWVSECRDRAQRRVISGEARVLFQPQQQVASVHFPFWPPFESIPEVHLWGGAKVRVKVGKIHPFGMRLDVRLLSPVTNESRIPVRFRAIGQG